MKFFTSQPAVYAMTNDEVPDLPIREDSTIGRPPILAIGLNPVWQKSLIFEHFHPEQVNRARTMYLTPGGKGIHFAIAANRMSPGSAAVAHFLGGEPGRRINRALADLGVPQNIVQIAADTRGCTTILCETTHTMTELIEPSPTILPPEVASMRDHLAETLQGRKAIALCGTYPPGIGPELYAWLAEAKDQMLLLLDGYRGVGETLATGKVDLLKINLDELRSMMRIEDPIAAGHACVGRYGLRWLAITDGPRPARLFGAAGDWLITLPQLEHLVNPIGAGDTTGAVMLSRLLEGADPADAFAWGLAAASASCLHIQGGYFSPADMDDLHAAMSIRRMT